MHLTVFAVTHVVVQGRTTLPQGRPEVRQGQLAAYRGVHRLGQIGDLRRDQILIGQDHDLHV